MPRGRELPKPFVDALDTLAASYLRESDPRRQSGFGGGAERWRAERSPLLDAVERSGSLLDVGCANGHLLECLVEWGRERGLELEPFGLDASCELIELARGRRPEWASRLFAGNAWSVELPRRFDYVYSLFDCVPREYLASYVERLLARFVADGGRLILGAYGSVSRRLEPFDVAGFLEASGFPVLGSSAGGAGPVTRFAWTERPRGATPDL